MSARWAAAAGLVALAAAGCSDADPGRVISGSVTLAGRRTDDFGVDQGALTLVQATGVPVFLLQGGRIVQSTASSDGRFQFFVPNGDGARVVAHVIGTIGDTLEVAAGRNTLDAGTLELRNTGTMRAWPNPYCACNTADPLLHVGLSSRAGDDSVCVRLRSAAGVTLRTLFSGRLTGWTVELPPVEMVDDQGQALPAGPYWITLDRTGGCGSTPPAAPPDSAYEAVLVSYTP